jgi:hypothetical protein
MGKLSTNAKIDFLQNYIRQWHQDWQKKHPENIVGFRIGKKTTKGITGRYYSIIFQVKKKKKNKNIKNEAIIPEYFIIQFPDEKKRKIKTDVEETGVFHFQSAITSEVDSVYSTKFGSAGLFVTDNTNRVYMLTNYHVVAEQMIANNQHYYRRPINQNQNDVKILINNSNQLLGRFEEGIISHEVDAAFVELFIQPDQRMNFLPDQNRVRGRISVRPYPPSFIGKPLTVYSFYNKMGKGGIINDNSSVLYTNNPNIYFEDIIQITPKITQGGDSGGIVLTPSFAVIGLIIGADSNYTYAIPFYKIDDFKNIFII